MLQFSIQLPDHTASEALVAVVEHRVLAGRDAAFGFIHHDIETAFSERPQPTADEVGGVTDPKI